MRKFINLFVLLALIFAPFILLPSTKVKAQAYRGLVIDEFVFYLNEIPRGTSVTKSFTITHDFEQKDKYMTLYIRAMDFTSDGVSGIPHFLKSGTLSHQASLASWITFDRNTINLTHYGQVETVRFTINVPQDAEVGGKYAAVLIGETPPEDAINYDDDISQVALSKELGPLVLLTTDGQINKLITLDELYTLTVRGRKTKFFSAPPVRIVAKLKNAGNVHQIPRGIIYVHKGDNFQEYDSKYELNDKKGYVLPGSTREFYADWAEGFLTRELQVREDGSQKVVTKINWDRLSKLRFGKYNITLLYSYEDNNGAAITNMATTYFFVIPWQLLLIVLIIIIIIIWRIAQKMREKSKRKNSKKD